jgi:hypothetical protein
MEILRNNNIKAEFYSINILCLRDVYSKYFSNFKKDDSHNKIVLNSLLGNKAANRVSSQMKEGGQDYIPTTQADSEARFVFWEPGSCLALAVMTMKSCKQCQICLEYFGADMGFACSKAHFICWDCLGDHVMHATGPDSVGKAINEKSGNLLCPSGCNDEITMLNIAKEKVPERIFTLIEKQKADFNTKKTVEKELKQQEERLRKEYEALMNIKDEEEREAARMRLDIVNEVLTLRCPRCKLAFLDYEGCAALTCAASTCKAGFCAMCLKDCGADAHPHVPRCPENRSGMYVPAAVFKEHHRKRQEVIINEKLKGLSAKTRGMLLEKIGKDLRDLRINVNPVQGANLENNAKSRLENLFERFF